MTPINDPRWAPIFRQAQRQAGLTDWEIEEGFEQELNYVIKNHPDLPKQQTISKAMRRWWRYLFPGKDEPKDILDGAAAAPVHSDFGLDMVMERPKPGTFVWDNKARETVWTTDQVVPSKLPAATASAREIVPNKATVAQQISQTQKVDSPMENFHLPPTKGFTTRWDFIFYKATKGLGSDPKKHLELWGDCISKTHKKCRVEFGEQETQRIAEILWWQALFPKENFPETQAEWYQGAQGQDKKDDGNYRDDHNTGLTDQAPPYHSMYEFVKLMGLRKGHTEKELDEDWETCLHDCVAAYEKDGGNDYVQYKAEWRWWRQMFPEEVFPGKNPLSGDYWIEPHREKITESNGHSNGVEKHRREDISLQKSHDSTAPAVKRPRSSTHSTEPEFASNSPAPSHDIPRPPPSLHRDDRKIGKWTEVMPARDYTDSRRGGESNRFPGCRERSMPRETSRNYRNQTRSPSRMSNNSHRKSRDRSMSPNSMPVSNRRQDRFPTPSDPRPRGRAGLERRLQSEHSRVTPIDNIPPSVGGLDVPMEQGNTPNTGSENMLADVKPTVQFGDGMCKGCQRHVQRCIC